MALTPQQKDTLRNIGTGTIGGYPVMRGPEKHACADMAFGKPRTCPCYACGKAREAQAAAVVKYGNKLPYQLYPLGKQSKGMR